MSKKITTAVLELRFLPIAVLHTALDAYCYCQPPTRAPRLRSSTR
jgi:hypothetical protein